MKNNGLFYLLFLFFCTLFLSQAFTIDIENHEVQQYIHNIRTAEAPVTVSDFLIFSQSPSKYTRYIGAAFEHEEYKEIHVFKKNRHNVFFLVYPLSRIPRELDSITYRIVTDGLWMTDPEIAAFERDGRGVRLSVLPVAEHSAEGPRVTSAIGDGCVVFYLAAPAGSDTAVIGDFNNWNPFSNRMTETEPGLYTAKVRTSPGIHTYSFVINGKQADVTRIETRPEQRVFIHPLGIRAVKINVK